MSVTIKEEELDESWDLPVFLLSDVAAAGGIRTGLLKAWLDRKIIPLGPHDLEAFGKGSSRILTLRRVFCVALAVEMTKLGMSASKAGSLASILCDARLSDGKGNELNFANDERGGTLIINPNSNDASFDCDILSSSAKTVAISEMFEGGCSVAAVSLTKLRERVVSVLIGRGRITPKAMP